MNELVKIEDLTRYFDIGKGQRVHAVDGVSLSIAEKEIVGLIKGIGKVAKKLGVSEAAKGGGYRSLVNVGGDGGQEVPHLHFHILGGEKVGKMVP